MVMTNEVCYVNTWKRWKEVKSMTIRPINIYLWLQMAKIKLFRKHSRRSLFYRLPVLRRFHAFYYLIYFCISFDSICWIYFSYNLASCLFGLKRKVSGIFVDFFTFKDLKYLGSVDMSWTTIYKRYRLVILSRLSVTTSIIFHHRRFQVWNSLDPMSDCIGVYSWSLANRSVLR